MRRDLLAALLVAGLHLAFLLSHFAPALVTPDAHGYLKQAEVLATEGRLWVAPPPVVGFVGPHWQDVGGGRYYSKYPPGLPVLQAVLYRAVGPAAAMLVTPLLASLTLLGLYLLARPWIGPGWALLAMVVMAANPVANEHALFGDAHTAVAFLVVGALLLLFRWDESRAPGMVFAAAVLAGLVPTVRVADGILLLGFAAYLLMAGADRRSLAAAALGAALPLAALAGYQHLAFGAPWRSGYSLSHEQGAFGLGYFLRNAPAFLVKLPTEGCGLAFLLGALGIGWMAARRETRARGVLLALLAGPITLLYTAYYWPPDPQSMRFLLPTFPVYILASAWLLHHLQAGHPRAARMGATALVLLAVPWGIARSLPAMDFLAWQGRALARVARAVQDRVPEDSVLVAPVGLLQDLDVRARLRLAAAWTGGPRPPGAASPDLRDVARRALQWSPSGRPVYWLMPWSEVSAWRKACPDLEAREVSRIDPPAEGPRLPPGGPGGRPPAHLGQPPPHPGPPGPMGPGRVFDLDLVGEPLVLLEVRERGGPPPRQERHERSHANPPRRPLPAVLSRERLPHPDLVPHPGALPGAPVPHPGQHAAGGRSSGSPGGARPVL